MIGDAALVQEEVRQRDAVLGRCPSRSRARPPPASARRPSAASAPPAATSFTCAGESASTLMYPTWSASILLSTGGSDQIGARELHRLRLRTAHAHHAQIHRGPGFALQQHGWHTPAAYRAWRFPDRSRSCRRCESPAFAAGEFGDDADHAHVPGLLGEDQADIGPLQVLVLQVFAILVGVQIAGERVDGFEQAVQSAPSVTLFMSGSSTYSLLMCATTSLKTPMCL